MNKPTKRDYLFFTCSRIRCQPGFWVHLRGGGFVGIDYGWGSYGAKGVFLRLNENF